MAHIDPTQKHETRTFPLPGRALAQLLAAPSGLARAIEAAMRPYACTVAVDAGGVVASGDGVAVALAGEAIERLQAVVESGHVDEAGLKRTLQACVENALRHDLSFRLTGIAQAVRPMSLSQVAFMNGLLHAQQALILGVGPTGTGKTHLAIAAGLNALARGKVKMLVASRPHALFEGETITASIRSETADDDQLAPLEDELLNLLGHEEVRKLKEREQLLLTPLGRMRGRTFNEAFIVIDEAQNLTVRKMRMAVTRMGRASRMVITGDPTQVDLHEDEPSGLAHLLELVRGSDIALVHEFERPNIIRNDVVARLEALYAREGVGATRGGGMGR
jgi:phosphate starvation-inducible PhoH-like protein